MQKVNLAVKFVKLDNFVIQELRKSLITHAENALLGIFVRPEQDQNMKIHVHKEHTTLLLVIRVQPRKMPVNHVMKVSSADKKAFLLHLVRAKLDIIAVLAKKSPLIDHVVLATTVLKKVKNQHLVVLENIVRREL